MERTKDVAASRFAYVAVVVPAMLVLGALALQLSWLPDTPNPIAVHWSGSGPDGSGPPWTYPAITLVMGFSLPALLWATGLPRLKRGARGWSLRFLAALALGMATFASISMSWSVSMQRGLDSWHDAPSVLPALVAGLTVGTAAGFVGWFVQPAHVNTVHELPTAAIDLAATERAVWIGVARSGRGIVITMVLAIVLVSTGAVMLWITAQYVAMWITMGIAALLVVSAVATLEADVRVDSGGVEVRGPAGIPRSHIPLAEIASARAVTVEALGDFGGWGWRRVPGAMGVVLRSGEALRVERTAGHALVVTVDGAATAAALVNALAERARH